MRLIKFFLAVIKSWKFIFLLVALYLFLAWLYLKDTPTQVNATNLTVIAAIPLVLVVLIWGVKKLLSKDSEETDDTTDETPTLLKPLKKKTEPHHWLYLMSHGYITGIGDEGDVLLSQLQEGFSPTVDNQLQHPLFMSPALSLRADISESVYLNSMPEAADEDEPDDEATLDFDSISERTRRIMALIDFALHKTQPDLMAVVALLPNQKKRQALSEVDPALLHHEWLEERINATDANTPHIEQMHQSPLHAIQVVHFTPHDMRENERDWLHKQILNFFGGLGCEPEQVVYTNHTTDSADNTLSHLVDSMSMLNTDDDPAVYVVIGAESHLDQDWLDTNLDEKSLSVGELGGVMVLTNHAFTRALAVDELEENTLVKPVQTLLNTKISVPTLVRRQAKLVESMQVDATALVSTLHKTEEKYHTDLLYLANDEEKSKPARSRNKTEEREGETNSESAGEKDEKIVYYLSDINKAKQSAHISEFQSFREHAFKGRALSDMTARQWVTCGELGESADLLSPFMTLLLAVDCPREADYAHVLCHAGDLCRGAFILYNNENLNT